MYRWVAEGAIALRHWFRRLRTRWEIRYDTHHASLALGCAARRERVEAMLGQPANHGD